MSEAKPMHRRWVGSLLSLLLPGAGIFFAGDKRRGLLWFLGLSLLSLTSMVLIALPAIPGLYACLFLLLTTLALFCWMLVSSFRNVPKLGVRGWIFIFILTVVFNVSEATCGRFFSRSFCMPTGSMEQTLLRGDHIFAQTCAYWFSKPRRGDVVVFKTDSIDDPRLRKGQFFVKRIAALPGERVQIRSGELLVDGKPVERPAVLTKKNFTIPGGGLFSSETNFLTLAADAFFVVGDNPTNSFDSRHFGPVPLKAIYGKATKIYWPLDRLGDIH